jgi:uncharacterized membrane protein/protein-disulfide isomerase
MTRLARPLIGILAIVALGASLASLYVHYRMIADPTYASFCDISETVSCEAVYESHYATVRGIPVAAGGAIWAGLMGILAFAGLAEPKNDRYKTMSALVFLLSIVGLAAVFYFGYASFVVLQKACVLCITVYVAVAGIFLVASGLPAPLGSLPSRLVPDLSATLRKPVAGLLAVMWLVASVGVVAFFPRGQAGAVQAGTAAPEPAVPVETLDAGQVAEWERWLDAQPQAAAAAPSGDVKVLVMKFNDYQCPACRQTYSLYKGIIEKFEASYPGVFRYESRDFPLESECGGGGVHGAACEAAAAVRMAREKNRHREVEAALFARQSPTMTREDVKAVLAEVAQISDFDARYAKVLEEVRADAQLGQRLGVDGTPTFFINGVKLSSLRPAYFEAAIAHALRKAGVMPTAAS